MQRFLFDRLCEPLKHMPIDSHNKLLLLRVSIVEALQRLFTHRSFFEGMQSTGPNSILNFGLKDLMSYSATIEDICVYKTQIRQMILQYEPRLINPDIVVQESNNPLTPAKVFISGQIKADELEDDFLWNPVITPESQGE
jgi:type VI secretion system lysozyme-like protein